jgi:hypothetical protein
MDASVIQRQLIEVAERIKTQRAELAHLDEQLSAAQTYAEDARLRGLMAETPRSVVDAHDAARRVELLARARASVVRSLDDLVVEQDALLDRLGSTS